MPGELAQQELQQGMVGAGELHQLQGGGHAQDLRQEELQQQGQAGGGDAVEQGCAAQGGDLQEVGAGIGQGVGDGDQRPAGGNSQTSPKERDDALGFAEEHDAEEAAQDIVEHEHQGIRAARRRPGRQAVAR